MAITRTIWKNPFTIDNVPQWTCPSCKSGTLIGDKKTIKIVESVGSKATRGHDEWDQGWVSGAFGGEIKCNNPKCAETVLIIGKMDVQADQEYDEQYGGWTSAYYEYLFPKAFMPALHIFFVHQDIPDSIKKAIAESFKVYWIDTSSCGNKIRTVVELIMDEYKISKIYTDKGKRREYSLHKRIELFKAIKPQEAEQLMAIKWIGNSGSHQNDDLPKDDILDAYEILEHVTVKLYEKDSHRIKKLSKAINKRRKPIGSRRTIKKK